MKLLDQARGLGWVRLPDALDVKYPQAPTSSRTAPG